MAVCAAAAGCAQWHHGRRQLHVPAQRPLRGGSRARRGEEGSGRGCAREQRRQHRLRSGAQDPQCDGLCARLRLLQVHQLRDVLLAALLPLAPLRQRERQRHLVPLLRWHDARRRHRRCRLRPVRWPPCVRHRHFHVHPRAAPVDVRHVLGRDQPHPAPRHARPHGYPRGRPQQHHHLGRGGRPRRAPLHRRQHPLARHRHGNHQRLGLDHGGHGSDGHRAAPEPRRLDRCLVLPHRLHHRGHGPDGAQDLEGAHRPPDQLERCGPPLGETSRGLATTGVTSRGPSRAAPAGSLRAAAAREWMRGRCGPTLSTT
mmetsp:Transcript_24374/g.61934  ORF Transcript_24374/g.61934 Transcript_24374/m.61934 type:complete len:314 (-) Transcript_24374:292-1233(-)